MPENFWIFVIKNTDEEFEKRMKEKSWPIYSYTVNRKRIRPGDKIAFYKAGEGNKIILGISETSSEIKAQEGGIDFTVSLRNIDVWNKPILMKPLVDKLDFIDNKDQWGRYMQGGVVSISKKDFETISAKSK